MNEQPFRVEEASIAGIQAAIIAGRTTCVDIVQQYLARVRAFNGVATMLVTEDGEEITTGPLTRSAPLLCEFNPAPYDCITR
jgi:Asp-tRNA(Asn)/Glu-tRNA(Gln) amidotransferase A subunit family amidase